MAKLFKENKDGWASAYSECREGNTPMEIDMEHLDSRGKPYTIRYKIFPSGHCKRFENGRWITDLS